MSGPKIDTISIEQMKAMQLAAEQSRNDSMLHDALLLLSQRIQESKADCLELRARGDSIVQELDRLEQSIRSSIIAVATNGYPSDPEEAKKFNDIAKEKLDQLALETDNRLDPITKRIKSAISGQREIASIERFKRELSESSSSKYGYLSSDLVRDLIERALNTQKSHFADSPEGAVCVLGEVEDSMRRLRLAVVSDATDAPRKRQLTGIARRINEALRDYDTGNSDISTVRQALAVAEPILSEIEAHAQVMTELYLDCLIAKDRIEKSAGLSMELMPIWQFREEIDLETTLRDLRNTTRICSEDAYVVHALDEVMAKHGYSIAKPIKLSESEQGGHRMFMSESSDIGIHTYLASNGVLAMEIAAVDESVRSQDDDELVQKQRASTAYDKLRLVHEQEIFCDLHPEIISDLAAYGICVNPKKDKEPSEDCAIVFSSLEHSDVLDEVSEGKRSSRRGQSSLVEREMR